MGGPRSIHWDIREPVAVEYRTRTKSRVLDDLVEKLRRLPSNHPDRAHLTRMIIDLSREIERSGPAVAPGKARSAVSGPGWLPALLGLLQGS
jgi:hypothetical protein